MEALLIEVRNALTQIASLGGSLQGLLKRVTDEAVANEGKAKELATEENEAIARDTSLNIREAEVKKVEDVIAIKDEAYKVKADTAKEIKEWRSEMEAQEAEITNQKAKNISDKQANLAEKERLKDDNELVRKEWKALRESKERMKDDLTKEMLRNLGKAYKGDTA